MLAAVASIALIGATLSPLLLRDPADDGFPLSTYPMFASKRPTTLTFHYALGEGRAGERVILTPGLVGTGEVLQAMRIIDNAVGGGKLAMVRLCDAIALRVADDSSFSQVTSVRIITGTHESLAYLGAGRIGRELERLRCAVKR